jgi:two-component system, LytTR family, response regulator AlgR
MSPLKILIVDDEAPARKRLQSQLAECSALHPLEVVGEAAHGREALDWMERNAADLALLDIRMPGMDGIELAQHLSKLATPPVVIFTTAYDDYAIAAFEVHAIDYLLKPIRAERLAHAVSRARAIQPLNQQTLQRLKLRARENLSVQERGRVLLIPIAEVFYLKAELKYVTVKTATREYLLEESLVQLEQEFGERFIRIHRNCLVARDKVQGFERVSGGDGETSWVALLKGLDEKPPVSRRQQQVVREFKAR